jgi:hypothetical protein
VSQIDCLFEMQPVTLFDVFFAEDGKYGGTCKFDTSVTRSRGKPDHGIGCRNNKLFLAYLK